MTDVDAVYMVRDRFGSDAAAMISNHNGTRAIFLKFPKDIVGWGKTWEEAFAMAVANRLLGKKAI